ncbi:MAG: hypothetical protein P8048_14400 [Calditrichia bacterium]
MHLKYRVEKSDLTAFARYHYQHSPAMKTRVTVWRWASALSGLIIIAADWATSWIGICIISWRPLSVCLFTSTCQNRSLNVWKKIS